MTDMLDGLILLPRLRVENANAISGPLTWGFPAPSAFTGFVHALQRKFGSRVIRLDGVGIVCHRFEPQVHKPSGKYHYRFNLARHPMGQDGKPSGTIEEGRAHLEVSLLIGVYGDLEQREGVAFAKKLHCAAQSMRLAGGSIHPSLSGARYQAEYLEMSGTIEGEEKAFRKLRRRLLPGFALINRHDLLCEHLAELRQQQPEVTPLDALLSLSRLNVDPVVPDPQHPEKVTWQTSRVRPGWLVPLPVGYGAISQIYPAGEVQKARDTITPFCFVESLYSLGEWLSPHRLSHPAQCLWYHQADPDAGLYLCSHNQIPS